MDQGEAGAVDPDDGSGCLYHSAQLGQQILCVGHGAQLSHGTGDKLIVHCDPWSFARADTASAVGHRWSQAGPDLATEPGTLIGLVGLGGGRRFQPVKG